MSYTNMADLERDIIRQVLDNVPTEELLRRVSTEERLKGLPMEELLKALTVGLSDEERRLLQQRLGQEVKPH